MMNISSNLRAIRSLAVASMVLLAGGCSDQGPEDQLLDSVHSARARWSAVRPAAYSYVLYRICECTAEMAGPVTVMVQGSDPVAWHYGDGGAVASSLQEYFPSVDGLLDLIEDGIRDGAFEVTVRYDTETGVPLEMRINYEQLVFDEEAAYRVEEVPTPLGS